MLVGIFELVGLVGVLSVPFVYFCLPGGRPPKEEKVFYGPMFSTSLKQSCQVDCYPVLVQGSGEHGAVSSLPVGTGQASDGWTSLTVPRSKRQQQLQVLFVPGQERVRSREGKFNFSERL